MKYLYLIFFSSFFFNSNAQTFSTVVQQLGAELKTVENEKTKISQVLKEIQPGVLNIEITYTTIKDGKSNVESYDLNMVDIDINTIKAFTNKDVIQVQLLANKKQKTIKKLVDNSKINYEDHLLIYAKNIDNGRDLVDLFKSLIPISTNIVDKRLALKSIQDHIDWLVSNVKDVKILNKQYGQKLIVDSKYPTKLQYVVDEISNQKSTNSAYHFNLANINPNSIFSEIKGDVIVVNFETKRKLKTIKTYNTSVLKEYKNNVSIYCDNIEKSRDLQKVLKGCVELSEDKIDKAIPKIKSISEGIGYINSYIKNVTINEISFTQNIDGDCVATINTKQSTNAKMVEEEYVLNFKDLAKNLLKYDTDGKNVYLELQTKAGNKYIKHSTNKELKSYANKFRLEFSEIEDAMISQKLFERIIELCENNETKLVGTKKDLLSQLKNRVKKVDIGPITMEQIIEVKDDGVLSFKNTEVSQKSSKSKLYEFNLKDINPANVSFNTSNTNVFVIVNTNYSEKIIKYYEDGAIKNYQSSFLIQTSTIEEARILAELIKKIVSN